MPWARKTRRPGAVLQDSKMRIHDMMMDTCGGQVRVRGRQREEPVNDLVVFARMISTSYG